MNDLDDRLTDLLARSAAAVDVHPDVDAVLADDHGPAPLVDLGRRPRDTRRLLALAAAGLVVVVLAGVGLVASRDDRPLEQAQAPVEAPGRFPVLGHLPADLGDLPVEANDGEGVIGEALPSRFRPETPLVHATLGRPADDGTVADVVQLVAGSEQLPTLAYPIPPTEDLGDGYSLDPRTGAIALHAPGATLVVAGGDGAADLLRAIAGTGLTLTGTPGRVPTLAIGDLPDGYEVIVPPTPTEPEQAEAFVRRGRNDLPVVVETGAGPPGHAVMSAGGPISPVDVDGGPGWMSTHDGRTRIAWTDPSGVTVSLIAEYGPAEALEIARGVALVDEATWRATYPEPSVGHPETATTVGPQGGSEPVVTARAGDLIGRPAPAIGGSALGVMAYEPPQDDGEWTIVSLTGSWCGPCVAMIDDLDALHRPLHADGRASVVSLFVADTVEAARAVADEHGIVWQALVTRPSDVEPWGVGPLPATVLVDPDGIVRSVLEGTRTAAEIRAALEELGG